MPSLTVGQNNFALCLSCVEDNLSSFSHSTGQSACFLPLYVIVNVCVKFIGQQFSTQIRPVTYFIIRANEDIPSFCVFDFSILLNMKDTLYGQDIILMHSERQCHANFIYCNVYSLLVGIFYLLQRMHVH